MTVAALEALTRNAVDVLPHGELARKLERGRPLRVKLGIDPTAPDIHLGHTVPLGKLAAFQRAGHTAVLIVGDYTARIGDPSGRSKERPVLSTEELDANARTFAEQAFRILDRERTEVRYNSEWLGQLDFAGVLGLTRTTTVARLLERDDFARRLAAEEPISISELLYPLMQGYDSVAIEADVELGGTDQLYNLLAGREVMQAYGLAPQVVLTNQLLVSWDGAKMSSSVGNNIPLTAAPEEQFGRTMRIPDSLLGDWWRLIAERPVPDGEPMAAKLALARWIVTRSHGAEAAAAAEAHFNRVVREREAPEETPEVFYEAGGELVHLPSLLRDWFALGSTSEARRIVLQGGLRIDGEVVQELDVPATRLDGALVQAGKRWFVRVFRRDGAA